VEGRDPASRRFQPVLVDGVAYSGNLLTAVTEALKRDHAYVNAPIVESQLTAGNLLVIFDGFSEVRESFFKDASSDIPSFVRQHPDTPFVFTSRSDLPSDLVDALGNSEAVRLLDIDDGTVKSFLGSYLKRGQAGAEELLQQIDIRFSSLPRIPLMLKLVATVYDTKGTVPKDTSTLFADYAEQVLRPNATGIDEPVGLHYAIRHLVRETYLRSGGDRGFSVDKGVELLERIKERLEAYAIRLEPIKMINLLRRAGLYRRVGEHLKFFHDSFESYFAARALESDFYDGKFDLLRECVGNARLQEAWGFLNEILQDEVAKKELQELVNEGAAAAAKRSYVERLLDEGVDYRIHRERDESNYRALVVTAEGQYPIGLGITREELIRLGKELRSQMDELSDTAVRAGKMFPERAGEHLRPLAELGYYAFGRIFSHLNLGANHEGLFAVGAKTTVQVVADSFFFPWEVIYPFDPTEGVSYKHFWGMNSVVSRVIVQNPADSLNGFGATPETSRPSVLLFADLRLNVIREEEIPFLERLREEGKIDLNVIDTNTFTDDKSVKEIKEVLERSADIIQFSCRCSYDEHFSGNTKLMFSKSFDLRLIDFEFQRIRLSKRPLVVMNTAEAGNLSSTQPSGFAAGLLSRGARGVVATECRVPATTAPIFSKQLYTRLLAGEPLGASVLAARKHLWDEYGSPVGLLYSIYAPPSLTVVDVEAEAVNQL
jgi:hypothetical protein